MGKNRRAHPGGKSPRSGPRPSRPPPSPSSAHPPPSLGPPVRRRHRKLEITFDADARRSYLTGFSARKRERRAFGLAMRRVEDRRAKVERRREVREARREREREGGGGEEDEDSEGGGGGGGDGAEAADGGAAPPSAAATATTTATFEDVATRSQFGGSVVVTTKFGSPSEDDDDDDDGDGSDAPSPSRRGGKGKVDDEQRYAGSVKRFMAELRGNMPSKKRRHQHGNRPGSAKKGGKHGAATMRGMGTASDVKVARKALARAEFKGGGGGGGGGRGRGKKRVGGKGRRGK